MPELPEVEVTRRRLAPRMVGRTVQRVVTTTDSYFFLTKPAVLKRQLPGRQITDLFRLGKYLLAELNDSSRLMLHLGMTGQLFLAGSTSPRLLSSTARSSLSPTRQLKFKRDTHTHLMLEFSDGDPAIFFRDVRKFGKVLLLEPGRSDRRLDRLGVDALSSTGDQLFQASRKRSIATKSLLLDQSVLAGVGNIYADEALYLAGVRPTRRAARLSRRDCDALVAALQRVMLRSIETGGSSISDYVAPDGSDGGYQDERWVYARTKMPCQKCGASIRRIVIGQRSTHYCPSCQR